MANSEGCVTRGTTDSAFQHVQGAREKAASGGMS